MAPTMGVVTPSAASLESSRRPAISVTPPGGAPTTVMVMDSESVARPSLTMKVSAMSPTWVSSGVNENAPLAPSRPAPAGKGRGEAEKLKGSPFRSVAASVRLSVAPKSTLRSPIAASTGAKLTAVAGSAVTVT